MSEAFSNSDNQSFIVPKYRIEPNRTEFNPDFIPNNNPVQSEEVNMTQKNPLKFAWNTIKGFGRDVRNAPLKASVAITAFAATQVADRLREPFVLLTDQATDTLSEGSPYFVDGLSNSIQAGVEAGSIFTASYFVIGMAGYAATKNLKESTEQITTQAPRLVKVSRYATRGNGYASRVGLGLSIGTVAEGCLSGIDGDTTKEAVKNVAKTSLAAGTAIIPLAVGFDGLTDYLIRNENYDAAQTIVDWTTSRYTWLGLMVLATAGTYRKNSRIAKSELEA